MVVAAAWTTLAERQGARAWLARHGAAVDEPTPLLALRVGARELAARSDGTYSVLSAVVWVVAVLPPIQVFARFLVFTVFCAAYPLVRWRRVRQADRTAARLAPAGARPSLRVAAGQVGWWYLAAVVTTLAGGVVMCVWFAANPAGWAVALVIGAASTAPVLGRALRAPVIAEDEASLAVDAALRAYDARVFAVSVTFAFLVWIDLPPSWPWPPARFLPAVGYIVLVLAVHVGAAIEVRRQCLPPGHYGTVTP